MQSFILKNLTKLNIKTNSLIVINRNLFIQTHKIKILSYVQSRFIGKNFLYIIYKPNIKLIWKITIKVSSKIKNDNEIKATPTSSSSVSSLNKIRYSKTKKIKKGSNTTTITSKNPLYTVKAYATADFYDLTALEETIKKSGAYEILDQDQIARDIPDNCLVARAKYPKLNENEPRYLFFFEEGAVVLWNCSNEEQNNILEMLNKISDKYYPSDIVQDESEILTYSENLFESIDTLSTETNQSDLNGGDSSSLNVTRLVKNHIYFKHLNNKTVAEKENLYEKYAFSDAIALSCMLGIWEKKLYNFTEKIEYISEDLKRGETLKLKTEDVLKKLGELFTMRHIINLNSNYLETPDFYWDREHLESLYSQTYYHLSVSKRTRLFNNRLNDCIDLMQILKEHLNDKKHTRLEWIIIGLIAIEASAALGLFDFIKTLII